MTWSAENADGFKFVSNPLVTTSAFAQLGQMPNGAFPGRRITVGRSFFAADGTKAGRLELPQGREDDGNAAGRTPTRRASS